jgi:pyruvate/2-oxoglutarate/acetoin dehydrogenase E1 component/TPP-dependent pyruvate/acetoin dehydrogenase alpha subunit
MLSFVIFANIHHSSFIAINSMSAESPLTATQKDVYVQEIINDYRLACLSREASLLGRKEVLTGKAKFGIFGDGKELAQIAMAKQFRNGDWRSGYYRDQTFMMAIGALTVQQAFAALYAHTDLDAEPTSGGRQMGGHFSTRTINEDGSWKNLMAQKNSSSDISPTAGQMPRLLGLALASKVFRQNEGLKSYEEFSDSGNEVAFGTIGDASTSEGLFWETINAAGVLQVPMVMSVWDDGFGISVPKKYQTTKESISAVLAGFEKSENSNGWRILNVKGWDYPALCRTYEIATQIARDEHVPVLIHVEEVTQPQGHSTSGSHERYKTKEQLEWGKEFDCVNQFKKWILEFKPEGNPIATEEELKQIEDNARKEVREQQKAAWEAFNKPIKAEMAEGIEMIQKLAAVSSKGDAINGIIENLKSAFDASRKDILGAARKTLREVRGEKSAEKENLKNWLNEQRKLNHHRYSSALHSDTALNVPVVAAIYNEEAALVDGRIILRDNFDKIFATNPLVLTFGEDTGHIGGVNQSMEGMQQKYGTIRVTDTGIREATILGQGIGMAMRGLRPIAEIQYLDYVLYCLQIMSDDLATVLYRTMGGQKAPLIVRTRGHRLEGIWHAGSPLGGIINLVRGMYVCVPRDMKTAAGFYNTLLQADEPALVIEPLNGYRSKEKLPTNLGEFTTPLGIPEVVKTGKDLTIVSYGSTFNICIKAAEQLTEMGIDAELIDVRTLLPFDINHLIADSLKKTNRLLIVDEDVPGGASAFILNNILNEQGGYFSLDSEPKVISAHPHRPAYGSDGDYFSKPNIDDIVEGAYGIMHESDPQNFPTIY